MLCNKIYCPYYLSLLVIPGILNIVRLSAQVTFTVILENWETHSVTEAELLITPCFFSFFKAINGVRGEVRMERATDTGTYKRFLGTFYVL